MSRDWQAYLDDMRIACEKVIRFTAGMDRQAFFADDRTYHAAIHCLLIVGEAAKRIPDDVRCASLRWNGVRSPECAIGWLMPTFRSTTTFSGT